MLGSELMTYDVTDFHTSKKCISMENDAHYYTKNRYNSFSGFKTVIIAASYFDQRFNSLSKRKRHVLLRAIIKINSAKFLSAPSNADFEWGFVWLPRNRFDALHNIFVIIES